MNENTSGDVEGLGNFQFALIHESNFGIAVAQTPHKWLNRWPPSGNTSLKSNFIFRTVSVGKYVSNIVSLPIYNTLRNLWHVITLCHCRPATINPLQQFTSYNNPTPAPSSYPCSYSLPHSCLQSFVHTIHNVLFLQVIAFRSSTGRAWESQMCIAYWALGGVDGFPGTTIRGQRETTRNDFC